MKLNLKKFDKIFFLFHLFLFIFFYSSSIFAYEFAFEKNSSLPIVSLDLMIKKGATFNPVGQYGLTNFLSEALLRGTKKHTKVEIDQILDQMSADISIDIRLEAVIFRATVLSSKLNEFLTIFEEILTEPNFSEKEIFKLKTETISAIKIELENDIMLGRVRFDEILFQNHPFGYPLMGTEKSIQNIKVTDLKDHYQRIFHPDFIKILGTGDASKKVIQKWSKNLINKIEKNAFPPKSAIFSDKFETPKNPENLRVVLIDKPDRTQTQIFIGQIGLLMTDPKFYPLSIANEVFGGTSFLSLLMKEIRTKRGWSYGVESTFKFGTQPRSWHVHLFPSEQDTPNALFETLRMIQELKDQGLNKEDFQFFKNSMILSNGFTFNTSKKRLENKIVESILNLPHLYIQTLDQNLSEVTLLQANLSIQEFLKPNQLTIVILCSAKNLKSQIAKKLHLSLDQIEVYSYKHSFF